MRMNHNEEEIIKHLRKVAQEEMELTPDQIATIDPDAPILDTLRLDSLRQVILVSSIERDYDCVFDLIELQEVKTLRDLVGMIMQKLSEGNSVDGPVELHNSS